MGGEVANFRALEADNQSEPVWTHGFRSTKEARGRFSFKNPALGGCESLSRESCCGRSDGRTWYTGVYGQECVPAKEGMEFQVGGTCAPMCVAMGTCGNGLGLYDSATMDSCPSDEEC